MKFGDHPDWPRVLAASAALPIDEDLGGEFARAVEAKVLSDTAETDAPLGDTRARWDAATIAQITRSSRFLTLKRLEAELKAIETIIDTARAFPEVAEAFDAGDPERAFALAEARGVNREMKVRIRDHARQEMDAALAAWAGSTGDGEGGEPGEE